ARAGDRGGLRGRRPLGRPGAHGRAARAGGMRLLLLLLLAAPAAAQVPADSLLPPEPIRVTAVPPDSLPLLTPDEVAARVLAENPTVAIARLDRAIAENDHSIGNAGFLPTDRKSTR